MEFSNKSNHQRFQCIFILQRYVSFRYKKQPQSVFSWWPNSSIPTKLWLYRQKERVTDLIGEKFKNFFLDPCHVYFSHGTEKSCDWKRHGFWVFGNFLLWQ